MGSLGPFQIPSCPEAEHLDSTGYVASMWYKAGVSPWESLSELMYTMFSFTIKSRCDYSTLSQAE